MKEEKKSSTQMWVGILVSVVCLAAIFFFIEPTQIWESLKSANYWYLLLTTLSIILYLIIRAWRWRFMLENEIAITPTFHIQNIGYLVNNYLPLRIGDITQAVLIGNVPPITISRGLSSVVMARILDMMFIVILLPFTLSQVETIPEQIQSMIRIVGVFVTVAIVLLVLAANQRPFVQTLSTSIFSWITQVSKTTTLWAEQKITDSKRPFFYKLIRSIFGILSKLDTKAWVTRIDDFLVGLSSLTHLKSGFILITYTILIWIPIIGAYYTGMVAVNLEPTIPMAAFVMCAAAFSVAAPSSPGQVGVYHAGVIFTLVNILGQPQAEAASFAFLYHAIYILLMTVLGIIGLLATGATFQNVINTTRQYLNKKDDDPELSHLAD
jgi:glycosyltransferase 2 family protein